MFPSFFDARCRNGPDPGAIVDFGRASAEQSPALGAFRIVKLKGPRRNQVPFAQFSRRRGDFGIWKAAWLLVSPVRDRFGKGCCRLSARAAGFSLVRQPLAFAMERTPAMLVRKRDIVSRARDQWRSRLPERRRSISVIGVAPMTARA